MSLEVRCDCGHLFSVAPSLAGGFATCPRCGKAASVPGLKDPAWRLLQAGAVVLWVGVVSVAWSQGGPGLGLAFAIGLGALLWLVSRAL